MTLIANPPLPHKTKQAVSQRTSTPTAKKNLALQARLGALGDGLRLHANDAQRPDIILDEVVLAVQLMINVTTSLQNWKGGKRAARQDFESIISRTKEEIIIFHLRLIHIYGKDGSVLVKLSFPVA